jgi:hypothetical protein
VASDVIGPEALVCGLSRLDRHGRLLRQQCPVFGVDRIGRREPRSGDGRRLPSGGHLRGPPENKGKSVTDADEVKLGVVLAAQHDAPAGAIGPEVVEAPAEASGQATRALVAADAEVGEGSVGDDDFG